MSCVHPGVPLCDAGLYPADGGPLWDAPAGAEGRAAELHWGTQAGCSLYHSRSDHERGSKWHSSSGKAGSCGWNGSCASCQQCWWAVSRGMCFVKICTGSLVHADFCVVTMWNHSLLTNHLSFFIPLSLSPCSQPLWVTFPGLWISQTLTKWIRFCPSMLALRWHWLQESWRPFHAEQACDGLWWTSPHCSLCRPCRPGCCTARPKQRGRWCSECWQRKSQTSRSSATLQVQGFSEL